MVRPLLIFALMSSVISIASHAQDSNRVQENEVVVHSELSQYSFVELARLRAQAALELGRSPASFLPSARVISVRRELALTEEAEIQTPQNIVLNSGVEKGISEGMILKVRRKIPIIDVYRDNTQKEMEVDLGQVEIIHVQKGLSVARLKTIVPATDGAWVGTRSVLIGDYVGQ